jgi:hypothetical protein
MLRLVMAAIVAVLASASPVAAQYRFDFRVDPQLCSWTWICDYGGRAYLPRRVHRAGYGVTYHVVHRHYWRPAGIPIVPDW